MTTLHVYSRQGCHLCEELIEELLPLVRGRADVQVRDIDTRDDWRERFDVRVPVVAHGDDVICEYHLDRDALDGLLKRLETDT